MKHEAIDPRRERLVAFLYGELSESEAREFRGVLATDAGLARELEEMRGAREALADWRLPEPTPSFVFVDEPAASKPRGPGWSALFAPFTRRVGGFGLGFGLAATAALLVAATGFRIERVDGGLAFPIGAPRPAVIAGSDRPSPSLGEPLELASGSRVPSPGIATPRIATAGGDPNEVLTRAEFDRLAGQMLGSIVDLLNEYDDRQSLEMSGVLHAMYERIADRQSRESEDIRQRMNALGVELLVRQARGGAPSSVEELVPASLESREFENPLRPLDWKEEWR